MQHPPYLPINTLESLVPRNHVPPRSLLRPLNAKNRSGLRSGPVLRPVPDAEDRHYLLVLDAVDDDVGENHYQFARSSLATRPAAAREHH